MFKVNNRNTIARCEINPKLKIKTPKRSNTSDMTKNLTSLTGWQAKLYRQAKFYFYVAVTCTIILFIVKFNTLRQLGSYLN